MLLENFKVQRPEPIPQHEKLGTYDPIQGLEEYQDKRPEVCEIMSSILDHRSTIYIGSVVIGRAVCLHHAFLDSESRHAISPRVLSRYSSSLGIYSNFPNIKI